MNSFKKMFQKFDDDQKVSLKHSKSMTFSSEGRKREPPCDDPSKPAYRGKTPLQKSDIVYVEQAPGILEIYHGKLSQDTYYHGATRSKVGARADLLAKFPHSPEPTEGLPRSGFRTLSLNSKSAKPQIPINNSGTNGQQAYPSTPHREQSGLAERIRAKSSTSRSNIPPPPAPALPTPAPAYPRSYWPYSQYDHISNEQDPIVLREMINRYPLTPVCTQRCPEHMRPMHMDLDEPHCPEHTLQWYIHMAFAERRPLDVRAGGRYRRVVDLSNMDTI
ncbi:hypothetical protein BDR04DRAFT_1095999 [Suillus decipiens]|nr:hypothetical protein BDR04DRAFT_1095999 [Suillus decipiens]